MPYDPTNIFAKMLRGEIPCKKVFENAHALAFHDIAPVAPVHILVIPKGEYRNFSEFVAHAPETLRSGYFTAIETIAREQNLGDYRLISNNGARAGQSVEHFHMHILAGAPFGPLLGG